MLCQDEDIKEGWASGQFDIAKINMENGLLDFVHKETLGRKNFHPGFLVR